MEAILTAIHTCTICQAHLEPKPIVQASETARLVIIGQAPGRRVHTTGIPWDDPSGNLLRTWLELSTQVFYNPRQVALIPMGFCYPGKGKQGDLPPRPECAPLWHGPLLEKLTHEPLILLIGQYSQAYYLGDRRGNTLTETVANWQTYLPRYLPLPHPSPRNRAWFRHNPWFETLVLPELRARVRSLW